MASDDLWGNINSARRITTPTTILRKAVTEFESKLDGQLKSYVAMDEWRGDTRAYLRITSPSGEGYEVTIAVAEYGKKAFPAILRDSINDEEYEDLDEASFIAKLADVLRSDEVAAIIDRLLSDFGEPPEVEIKV